MARVITAIWCVMLTIFVFNSPFSRAPFTLALPRTDGGASLNEDGNGRRAMIELEGGPEDVAWVVQLSDLHFSVHHPDRALDFKAIVGPALAMVNPSLVFITGDLTDGKSKDLLTMKQDEAEWVEYQKVMEDVIKRSGLKRITFYDLRGNHDNFGVPDTGGSFDFYSKYSINGQMGRNGSVNSVTMQTGTRNLLFVEFDSTTSLGLRGPTNLFGHPTDQLLSDISSELSQLDPLLAKPIVKISLGHFPLSFSAAAYSRRTLKDVFLTHSLSAYLCGHLHTRFGKNLKRHHQSNHHPLYSQQYFQLNGHGLPVERPKDFSLTGTNEFWEWEMGDWRKSRAMRILAIDRGWISFVDIDFRLGAKKTIILPTFPLDSRFILDKSFQKNESQPVDPTFYSNIRVLVFSSTPIVSVVARIYDSRPGKLIVVIEAPMKKNGNGLSRGDLYTCPWNFKAFEDPSPERFLLQIETVDISGRSTLTELRPFSIVGQRARLPWNWKEFFVMGCQWDALYYPIFWSFYLFILSILLVPKAIFLFSRKQYTYRAFISNKGLSSYITWILMELYSVPWAWYCMVGYLFYLILCPWLCSQVLMEGERGYMTFRGWAFRSNTSEKLKFVGFPDIMVVVLPHLYFVVLPALFVIIACAAERGIYRDYLRALSGKKDDSENKISFSSTCGRNYTSILLRMRWIRKALLLICLAICWKHFMNCRALCKAYEMNPFIHFPVYSLAVPLLLVYTIHKTSRI
nr:putative metallophosphoesterase At3g03305 [Ipomoea batatas]